MTPTSKDEAPPPPIIPSELSYTAATTTLSSLSVQLDLTNIPTAIESQLEGVMDQWRASCYLAAAQIFLQSNATMKDELRFDDIKPRLLGHWGTTSGLALACKPSFTLVQI